MTVKIHGKDYKTVAERVDEFRTSEEYKGWSIVTQIISNDNEFVVIEACIGDKDGKVIANGHAQEKYGSTNINQTSALENCETSAIGRALACLGLAGTEFASADEVANAINQQKDGVQVHGSDPITEKQMTWLMSLAEQQNMTVAQLGNEYINRSIKTKQDAKDLIEQLKIAGVIDDRG